jgi:hypothetical protein
VGGGWPSIFNLVGHKGKSFKVSEPHIIISCKIIKSDGQHYHIRIVISAPVKSGSFDMYGYNRALTAGRLANAINCT